MQLPIRSDAPLLQRPRLGSGSGVYEFDPISLITYASPGLEEPDEPDIDDHLAYHRGSAHESHHWLQWIGTTIGAFLNAVRYSSEQTALLLSELDAPVQRWLYEERFGTPRQPIVGLAADYALLPASGRGLQPLESIVQGWYDHLTTYRLFLDSSILDDLAFDPQGMAETIADVAEVLHRVGVSGEYDYVTVRELFTTSNAQQRVAFAGERLTTTGIMEAAATANEILASLATARASLELAAAGAIDAADRFEVGSYGVAGKMFSHLVQPARGLIPWGLWTFGVVCDVALNPPLPPIVRAGSQPVAWSEVYPPLRFARACLALKQIADGLDFDSGHDDYERVIRRVCEVAGLQCHLDFVADLCGYQNVDWLAACGTKAGQKRETGKFPGAEYSYFDYILWCTQNAWALRRENLPALINSGWARTTGRHGTSDLMFADEGAGWFNAPIWAIGERFGYTERIQAGFGTWLCHSAAIHASTHDLMTGIDDYTINSIPPRLRERLREAVDENVRHWLKGAIAS